jgi:predicted amidohydrolase YtcJ
MNQPLRLLTQACAALLALTACAKRQAPESSEVTLHTGTLYTLDPGRPEARAIAVHGGRILRLGTVEALEAAYPGATRVDHGERVLLPGFGGAGAASLRSALTTPHPTQGTTSPAFTSSHRVSSAAARRTSEASVVVRNTCAPLAAR